MTWIHVDKNAIAANDRDGGQRPVLVVNAAGGGMLATNHFKGHGFEVRTQYSHPQADRPHAWIEVL